MSLTTAQKGRAVEIESRPGFTQFINTDFPENDKFREQEQIVGEEGKAVTEIGVDSTQEVSAKLVVEDGTTLPVKFDVLTETGTGGRKWLILEISRPRAAGKGLILDLKLKRSEGVDLSA